MNILKFASSAAPAAVAVAMTAWVGAGPSAFAQPPMANPDPAAVQGGAFVLDPNHTQILFKVSHFGFSTYYGEFSGASGSLRLDTHDLPGSRLEVMIPTASVHTTSARLDEELKGADWFDAAKYPTISFQSTRVTETSPDRADIEGALTFHGVTRPVTLHARFNGAGNNPMSRAYTAGFEVSGKLSRTAFGVAKFAPMVGDDVDLIISGAFERKPG